MPRKSARALSGSILKRIDALAAISAGTGRVTRHYLSAEHRAAVKLVLGWMADAGLAAHMDAAGNVVGRLEGSSPDAKTLLIGSHLASLNNSGRFVGVLGLLCAIAAIGELVRTGRTLPFAVEVVAFGDLEGHRFGFPMSGSSALAGTLPAGLLAAVDVDGIPFQTALRAFGGDPDAMASLVRETGSLLGYIGVSIEQGRVLEQEKLALGVVTVISGCNRYIATVTGVSAHAGTQPMPNRRDALAAAAEMVLAIEEAARTRRGLIATVGSIVAEPGLVNVVPGHVRFTLDIRSSVDGTRRAQARELERTLKAIARRRQVDFALAEAYSVRAAASDHRFIRHFSAAMERAGLVAFGLPSGAGHDGLTMAWLCPVGMMFVRGRAVGRSGAEEIASAEDIEKATRVLIDFLQTLCSNGRSIDALDGSFELAGDQEG